MAQLVKNLPANAGTHKRRGFNPWLGRFPGGGHGNTLQYSCLENPHGLRCLAGYSSWGLKELEATKRINKCLKNSGSPISLEVRDFFCNVDNGPNFSVL